jgi:hypothetical protein
MSSSCAATASTFGAGCGSSAGTVTVTASTQPWLGHAFRATAVGIPAPTLVISIWGLSSISVALPAILPQAGAGCVLLASPDYLEFVQAPSSSLATAITLPAAASLIGLQFFHQVAPLELGPGGITLVSSSNGLSMTIGSF